MTITPIIILILFFAGVTFVVATKIAKRNDAIFRFEIEVCKIVNKSIRISDKEFIFLDKRKEKKDLNATIGDFLINLTNPHIPAFYDLILITDQNMQIKYGDNSSLFISKKGTRYKCGEIFYAFWFRKGESLDYQTELLINRVKEIYQQNKPEIKVEQANIDFEKIYNNIQNNNKTIETKE